MPAAITIAIDPPNEDLGKNQRASLRAFLLRAARSVPLYGEVSVLVTSDGEIRRLNRAFRHKNRPTDVLSFPAADFQHVHAGDLAISIDTAARQASAQGHSLETELRILLLHGLLHLAGYDHEADRGEMAAREESLRRRFRLPGSLTGRGTAAATSRKDVRS
jgi:probable rRNA maturation factor